MFWQHLYWGQIVNLLTALILSLMPWALNRAEPPAAVATENEFWQRLGRPAAIFWTEVQLREGLSRLGQTYGVAIMLDRRCDPNQPVSLTVRDRPLREVIKSVAEHLGYQVAWVAPLVYVGPQDVSPRLELLIAENREALSKRGPAVASFLRSEPVSWPRLATPRDLVVAWARQAGWQVTNPEEIPHDLWADMTLPPMTLADRLTLVLFQFDLTLEVGSSSSLRIIPLPPQTAPMRRFAVGPDAPILAQRLQREFADCRIVPSGSDILVSGPENALERLSQMIAASTPRPSGPQSISQANSPSPQSQDPFAFRRFTVREGRGTLEGVIRQLTRQLEMEVLYDPEAIRRAGIPLEQPIQFRVENGTIDELWRAVLEPQNLRFDRSGRTLRIFPAR